MFLFIVRRLRGVFTLIICDFFLKLLTFNKTNIQYFYFNKFVKILIFFVELKISSEGATENKKNGPSSVFINLI